MPLEYKILNLGTLWKNNKTSFLLFLGYDEDSNPFASSSAEYTKKKEEQMEQRRKKKLSAKRQQINKDNELWERNRMLTSGVVHAINVNQEFDEVNSSEVLCIFISIGHASIHVLVFNIMWRIFG